eukprot:5496642-Amphidinium_carterae.1
MAWPRDKNLCPLPHKCKALAMVPSHAPFRPQFPLAWSTTVVIHSYWSTHPRCLSLRRASGTSHCWEPRVWSTTRFYPEVPGSLNLGSELKSL